MPYCTTCKRLREFKRGKCVECYPPEPPKPEETPTGKHVRVSDVTIREETAELVLKLLTTLEYHTAKSAAVARTNGEASVERFASVTAAIIDLRRGLYG